MKFKLPQPESVKTETLMEVNLINLSRYKKILNPFSSGGPSLQQYLLILVCFDSSGTFQKVNLLDDSLQAQFNVICQK